MCIHAARRMHIAATAPHIATTALHKKAISVYCLRCKRSSTFRRIINKDDNTTTGNKSGGSMLERIIIPTNQNTRYSKEYKTFSSLFLLYGHVDLHHDCDEVFLLIYLYPYFYFPYLFLSIYLFLFSFTQ